MELSGTAEKALVTGGAGFLGSHVAEALVRGGMQVVVVDDLSGGFKRNVPEGCEFIRCSVIDHARVDELFARHRFDYVYHLAAYAAENLSHFIRRFNYTNNLLGSVNLINAAVRHAVRCFVFTSSIAVYGSARSPIGERTAPEPGDPYGIAKLAVERDLLAAHELFGLDHVIFRPHNVYGERQNLSDPYRNVIGIFMNQILRGRPCTVFGDGTQTRAFSHVSDVAPAIAESVRVGAARNGVFNIGADEPCSIIELARMVQNALGRQVGIEHLPPRKEARHAYCDHTKVRKVFGLGSPLTLQAGLDRMAKWAATVEIRSPRAFGDIEIQKGLPPSWERSRAPAAGGGKDPSR
jgi:UDP-glucose 4-epimerase